MTMYPFLSENVAMVSLLTQVITISNDSVHLSVGISQNECAFKFCLCFHATCMWHFGSGIFMNEYHRYWSKMAIRFMAQQINKL